MHRLLIEVLVLVVALVVVSPASAWWGGGHDILSLAAVEALPDDVPAFFREGGRGVAHASYDPDISKNRATPIVSGAEHGEHFLDLELLDGKALPEDRFAFIALCQELGQKPEHVGFVAYAVAEWTERLAVAFAEHRKWPDNPYVQSKCLLYAGFVAHYAQDMCQPLHLTIHFDGLKQEDGSRKHRGIHEKVDALPEFFEMKPRVLANGLEVTVIDSLMPAIVAQLESGFALVDDVYELGDVLPKSGQKDWQPNDAAKAFAMDRARESVRFTASLILTAWRRSAGIRLHGWLDRSVDTP